MNLPRRRSSQADELALAKRIAYYENARLVFSAKLAQPDTTAGHRASLAYNIFKDDLEQMVARYSAGEEIAVLKAHLPRVVAEFAARFREEKAEGLTLDALDNYSQVVWLVSLALLLDTDVLTWRTLITTIDATSPDALLDRLIALRDQHRPIALRVLFPKPYAVLLAALSAGGKKQSDLVTKFLAGYYKSMKTAYWHDTHAPRGKGFFGYWCFELAAFAKKLPICDEAFSDNIYYPRDLVR
jgi:Domain of unknown function (DUF1911)/Domain of unknown function (DUF1910)